MLTECIWCGRNVLKGSVSFWKLSIPRIHQDNKLFKSFWCWGTYIFFASCKRQKCLSHRRKSHPCFSCFEFAPSCNERNSITPCDGMKTDSALHLSGPSLEAMSWIAIYLKCFPVSNDVHSSLAPSCCERENASTTTSVSDVLMMIIECSCLTQSAACNSRRVSASSCVQGAKFPREISPEEQTTFSWHVLTICLPDTLHFSISFARKAKRSCLFASCRRNPFQSEGTDADGNTFLCCPWPLFCLVLVFKFSAMYTSRTTSNLCTLFSYWTIYGMNTSSV